MTLLNTSLMLSITMGTFLDIGTEVGQGYKSYNFPERQSYSCMLVRNIFLRKFVTFRDNKHTTLQLVHSITVSETKFMIVSYECNGCEYSYCPALPDAWMLQ